VPTVRMSHTDDATAPLWARDSLADVLRDEGIPEDDRFDLARLVVSELVTNVVRHGGRATGAGEVELTVAVHPHGVVRVEVADNGDPGSVRRCSVPGMSGGWGLNVVHRAALDWGVRPRSRWSTGKVVWAELHVSTDG
jgi:anti-sigma regulatory factor (Ser/Thr protein kinase)